MWRRPGSRPACARVADSCRAIPPAKFDRLSGATASSSTSTWMCATARGTSRPSSADVREWRLQRKRDAISGGVVTRRILDRRVWLRCGHDKRIGEDQRWAHRQSSCAGVTASGSCSDGRLRVYPHRDRGAELSLRVCVRHRSGRGTHGTRDVRFLDCRREERFERRTATWRRHWAWGRRGRALQRFDRHTRCAVALAARRWRVYPLRVDYGLVITRGGCFVGRD